jgi:hypothetical protein
MWAFSCAALLEVRESQHILGGVTLGTQGTEHKPVLVLQQQSARVVAFTVCAIEKHCSWATRSLTYGMHTPYVDWQLLNALKSLTWLVHCQLLQLPLVKECIVSCLMPPTPSNELTG